MVVRGRQAGGESDACLLGKHEMVARSLRHLVAPVVPVHHHEQAGPPNRVPTRVVPPPVREQREQPVQLVLFVLEDAHEVVFRHVEVVEGPDVAADVGLVAAAEDGAVLQQAAEAARPLPRPVPQRVDLKGARGRRKSGAAWGRGSKGRGVLGGVEERGPRTHARTCTRKKTSTPVALSGRNTLLMRVSLGPPEVFALMPWGKNCQQRGR